MALASALLAAALLAGGCGGDDGGDEPGSPNRSAPAAAAEKTTSAAAEATAPAKRGTSVKLAPSPVGDALFDGDDQAIYLFDIEEGPTAECYGDCAAAWPPVLTKGEPVAEGPVEQSLLGTTKRDDGTAQVTYNDHPLYYYAHEGPGELVCHNVSEFGGVWLALDESGNALS